MISGLWRVACGVFALLGCYESQLGSFVRFVCCLTFEDGTNRLSRNRSN